MSAHLLIEAVVQQTMVFIAQLATAGGVRAPLAHVAGHVFLDLTNELQGLGVRKNVIAGMFGMGLRTYHRRVRELSESKTDAGKSVWEAVLGFIRQREPVSGREVLQRFVGDDPDIVAGVLGDLSQSGLVYRAGRGDLARYRIADEASFSGEDETLAAAAAHRLPVQVNGNKLAMDYYASWQLTTGEWSAGGNNDGFLPHTGWTLVSVDSEETTGEDGHAINAFDGSASTFWHTQWQGAPPPPDPTAFCAVNPITAPDQVSFKAGAQAIMELQTGAKGKPKYQPVGATPTFEAVVQADKALSMATLAGNTGVILITDGDPNCMWDQGMTVSTITGWLTKMHIQTYVVGLPGTSTNGTTVLNALATAGGTAHYLMPDGPAKLTMLVEQVVQRQLQFAPGTNDCTSCSPVCTGDTRCIDGSCKCPNISDVSCDGTCIDIAWTDHNCGACGHVCASGETCCTSKCVNTKTDKANCGACNGACGSQGDACTNGACTCRGGSFCPSPMTCSAGSSGTAGAAACQ